MKRMTKTKALNILSATVLALHAAGGVAVLVVCALAELMR